MTYYHRISIWIYKTTGSHATTVLNWPKQLLMF